MPPWPVSATPSQHIHLPCFQVPREEDSLSQPADLHQLLPSYEAYAELLRSGRDTTPCRASHIPPRSGSEACPPRRPWRGQNTLPARWATCLLQLCAFAMPRPPTPCDWISRQRSQQHQPRVCRRELVMQVVGRCDRGFSTCVDRCEAREDELRIPPRVSSRCRRIDKCHIIGLALVVIALPA